MSNQKNFQKIQALAEMEGGVFTSALAASHGVPAYALTQAQSAGKIERIARGAYRMTSALDDGLDELRAIYKLTRPEVPSYQRMRNFDGIAVTGTTAACIHGIGNFYPTPYQIGMPQRRASKNPLVDYLKRTYRSDEVLWKSGVMVVRPELVIAELLRTDEDRSLVAETYLDAITALDLPPFNAAILRAAIGERAFHRLSEEAAVLLPDDCRIVELSGCLSLFDERDSS